MLMPPLYLIGIVDGAVTFAEGLLWKDMKLERVKKSLYIIEKIVKGDTAVFTTLLIIT